MANVCPQWWRVVEGPRDKIWDFVALVITSSALVRYWNFVGGSSIGFKKINKILFKFQWVHIDIIMELYIFFICIFLIIGFRRRRHMASWFCLLVAKQLPYPWCRPLGHRGTKLSENVVCSLNTLPGVRGDKFHHGKWVPWFQVTRTYRHVKDVYIKCIFIFKEVHQKWFFKGMYHDGIFAHSPSMEASPHKPELL